MRTLTPTVFWGTACISERESPTIYKESKDLVPLTDPVYNYQMPTAAGKGIVIYILENTLGLGYSPKNLKNAQDNIQRLIDNKKSYYSSKELKQDLEEEGVVLLPLAGAEIDIDDARLEVIWPINKIGTGSQARYECSEFSSNSESYGASGEGFHGSVVANLAAGTRYGAAPKASVVLVNKPSSGPGPGAGVGLAYRAILQHYHTLPKGTHAILNVSAGSTASTIQYNIDAISDVENLSKAGILIVSAAGNRAEDHSTEMTTEKVAVFWTAVKGFPYDQYEPVRTTVAALKAVVKLADQKNPAFEAIATQAAKDLKLSMQGTTLQKKVDDADKNTQVKPLPDVPAKIDQKLKDSLRGIFVMADIVFSQISIIDEEAKTSLGSELAAENLTLKDVELAIEALAVLFEPEAPKLPAVLPYVLSVGGLSTKDSICKEFYYGNAVDIYAPAQSIPFMDKNKNIHDTYEKPKKGEPTVIETLRLNGTSFASPITAGAIACLISENLKSPPEPNDVSEVNKVGREGLTKDKIIAIARTPIEPNGKTPPTDETFKIVCVAPAI